MLQRTARLPGPVIGDQRSEGTERAQKLQMLRI